MYIKKLIIKNYKSIKDEIFEFNKGVNVLVGKNNAGKSNIVSALNEVLSDKYNTSDYEDKIFYTDDKNPIKKEFKIIAEIDEIKDLDFSGINNIKKKIGLIEITDYFNENDNSFDNEWIIEDDDELRSKYPTKLSGSKKDESSRLKWANKEDMIRLLGHTEKIWLYKYYNKEKDTNLLNIIMKVHETALLDETKYYRMVYIHQYVKSVLITSLLIPAFRSPENTLRINKWTWYGKLLQKKWEESCTEEHQKNIKLSADNLKNTIGEVYVELKNQLNEQLAKTLNLMKINVDISMIESKSEDYYKNIKLHVNDGVETPLENKGSGLQSLIMIELFKLYCKMFNQTSLLILEEPELFLHPHAKRMLSDILNDFVNIDGTELKNQIIITTHSEEFIHNIDLENINVIKKGNQGTKKYQINKKNYTEEKELQKLKVELQYKNTEIFFADKVILVEGEERVLIPKIVEYIYKKNVLNSNDISIVKVGGKSYFSIYRKVLNDLGIENYIIADYDIIENGIEQLLDIEEVSALNALKSKMGKSLKSSRKLKNECVSRDWESLVTIVNKIITNKKYDDALDSVWLNFSNRIYEKEKLEDFDEELKQSVLEFIDNLYKKNIYIMKKGELEDYYIKENFDREFNGIPKGIVPYKIIEKCDINDINHYMNIAEYKDIMTDIFKKKGIANDISDNIATNI